MGETFNTLYTKEHILKNAEDWNDPKAPTVSMLKDVAKSYNMHIVRLYIR